MPKPPPARWQPFTAGQYLPEAGVTVMAVMLGASASVTYYDLRFDCCGNRYALNHITLARRVVEGRQACRRCGPIQGGQRGGKRSKFTPWAVGERIAVIGVTVLAVHLGADAESTHYSLVCDCGANRYDFTHKHLRRQEGEGRHRCPLCRPAAVPAGDGAAAGADPVRRLARGRVFQGFALGPLPAAGVTLLAESRADGVGGEWDAVRYRVRYDCCGATGELGYRVIARRAREKVQRCGACARRANGLARRHDLGGAVVNGGQEVEKRGGWIGKRRRAYALGPASAWPRPPMLVGLPPFVWGGQP
jgi:hypothetical protein